MASRGRSAAVGEAHMSCSSSGRQLPLGCPTQPPSPQRAPCSHPLQAAQPLPLPARQHIPLRQRQQLSCQLSRCIPVQPRYRPHGRAAQAGAEQPVNGCPCSGAGWAGLSAGAAGGEQWRSGHSIDRVLQPASFRFNPPHCPCVKGIRGAHFPLTHTAASRSSAPGTRRARRPGTPRRRGAAARQTRLPTCSVGGSNK